MAMGLRMCRADGMEQNTGGVARLMPIATGTTQAIFTGDPVKIVSGNIQRAVNAEDIEGVFNGCQYVEADGSYKYRSFWDGNAGRSNIKAEIIGAHFGTFQIETAPGTNVVASMIGQRYDVVAANGSTQYGDSRYALNVASAQTNGQCYVLGLVDFPGNTFGGESRILEVRIARPAFNPARLT